MARPSSIFGRLLLAIAGTALLVALAAGAVHYFVTSQFVETWVKHQLQLALDGTLSRFSTRYMIPVSGDLRMLASVPVVDRLLMSFGEEVYINRPEAERLLLAVSRSRPLLYRSVRLVDLHGQEQIAVHGRKRRRSLHHLLASPTDDELSRSLARLFTQLSSSKPGTIMLEGPLRHKGGGYSYVTGIAKEEPEIGGFGGAVLLHVDLNPFLAHVGSIRILGHAMAWLFDADGNVVVEPPSSSVSPNPHATLFAASTGSATGAIVFASGGLFAQELSTESDPGTHDYRHDAEPLKGMFRLAVSMSPDILAQELRGAAWIGFLLLIAIGAFAAVVSLVVARQLSLPIRILSRRTALVSDGDLEVSVPERWSGELGVLAGSFNRMVISLRNTTVSKAYVDNILRSMPDAVLVLDSRNSIREINRAGARMLGYEKDEIVNESIDAVLADPALTSMLARCLFVEQNIYAMETECVSKGGGRIPVSLSCSVILNSREEAQGLVCVMQDITERKRAESALRGSEQRYRALYDDNPSMFFTVDVNGRLSSANRFAAEQLGFETEELIGLPLSDIHRRQDRKAIDRYVCECLQAPTDVHRWEIQKLRKDGSTLWVRESARVVAQVDGSQAVLTVCEDVTEARKLSQQLSYQASHDALTELINRREFERRSRQVLEAARRDGSEHALCYVDLDQFKVLNDTCGHIAGDQLLRQLGVVMQDKVRKNDTIARLGGDEFGLLLERCPIEQARRIASAVLRAIDDFRFVWDDKSFSIGASIGVVPITETSGGPTALLAAADSACYAAKEQGRNRVHIYREDDAELTRRHAEMQWVARINRALEERRFHLDFQPIVPVSADGNTQAVGMQHYELLMRMQDEEGRTVLPGAFLPAAEHYGLAPRLDRWVVGTALEWLAHHPVHLKQLSVCSINLSGLSLSDDELLGFILTALDRSGVPAHKICFEVTETAAITHLPNATRFIKSMKQRGCRFALDDFGSGLSSFAYLKSLPVDFLKIDGMFVRDIAEDPIDFAMVRSINEIGHVMGKQTIAEFVEDEAILVKLREIGVDFAQGYGIGRPQPLEEMDELRAAV